MNSILKDTCEKFISNRDMLRKSFKNEGSAMHLMGAALLTSAGDGQDAEALRECERILKKHEGFFSPFRGALKFPVLINMSRKEDPENYLKLVREAYDLICINMGSRNERYYLTAMEIAADAGSEDEIADLVDGRVETSDANMNFKSLLTSLESEGNEIDIDKEIKDAEDYLSMQKGFGVMGAGTELKHMYSEMLVCTAHGLGNEAGKLAARLALDDALQSRFRA